MPLFAVFIDLNFGMTAKFNAMRIFQPLNFPNITITKPMIGFFNLFTINNSLGKHPIFVT